MQVYPLCILKHNLIEPLQEFELQFNDCNLVWEVSLASGIEELVPVEACWGCVPKYDALDHNKVSTTTQ